MKTVPGLSSWELDNWLITTFLKQNLIVKTSNTLHQPSSRGHWCPLPRWAKNSALGSHHTNSKSKTGIRTALTWMQEEQQRLGRPKTKLKRKQRKRKNEVDCLSEVTYAWQVPSELVVKWDWIRIWFVSEKGGKAKNPQKTLKQGKNQNTDLTHFITLWIQDY